MNDKGKVYLLGGGIGDGAYLTVRGKELLSSAEVIIYDALINSSLLDLAPQECLKIEVGKRGGKTSTSQERINQLLIAYCCQGKQVVRLKSGDPFIFGRTTQEIRELKKNECNFEIIPGISSALAAPLLAGISLTDKNLSKCFVVCSGHQPDLLNWQGLSTIDTIVILMGGRSLNQIIDRLINYGRNPHEPIAIVRNCGDIEQEIFWGTLTDIVEKTKHISLSPAVIIIGEVVSLQINNSINDRSKLNKTILVTRSQSQSSKFTTLLQNKGAKVLEMPALVITPPSSWLDLDNAIENISDFDWLILTSANGVKYFFERLKYHGKDVRVLARVKIAVVGKKTATTLEQQNLKADFIPPNFIADSLVATFPENLQNKKILFPRVETGGRDILVKELTTKGAKVTEVSAYESQCPDRIDSKIWDALENKKIDVITFASSKTVKNFLRLIAKELSKDITIDSLLKNINIASIGPQTSQTCYELLGRVDIEAKEYTLEGLTEAIVKKISNEQLF